MAKKSSKPAAVKKPKGQTVSLVNPMLPWPKGKGILIDPAEHLIEIEGKGQFRLKPSDYTID